MIKRMEAEGHTVGNHTMTHPDMSKISTQESFQKELAGVEDIYKEITGKEMTKFYRPPQGIYSTLNLSMAKEMGYHTFFWSLAYVDWYQDKQPSKEEAFDKLLNRIHPGAVVLLHISPVNHDFCAQCRRIRVTADGKLKGCLHSAEELPLRGLHGKELEDAIRQGILQKPERHHLTERRSDTPRNMNQIGG